MANKTSNMVISETKESVINTLNASNLPISVIDLIIKDIARVVSSELEFQLKREKEMYDQQVVQESIERNREPLQATVVEVNPEDVQQEEK